MASLPKPFLTEQEYLEIERAAEFKSEYLNGQMYAMAGTSVAHADLTLNLGAIFKTQLRGKTCKARNSDLRVKIPRGNLYTYPDLSVACGPKFADDVLDTLVNPVLIVEVLSASTRDYDRGEKLRLYQTIPSFVEYLLVDQYTIAVEHWRKQPDASWLVREIAGLDGEVLLDSVGCRIGLRDIYDGIEFD
jgi:Uma2 family endonuclease